MTREEMKESVIDLLEELLEERDFDRDILEYTDLIDDAAMDSITFITLIIEIEKRFHITVPDDFLLMDNFKNVNDIVAMVEKEIAKGADGSNG